MQQNETNNAENNPTQKKDNTRLILIILLLLSLILNFYQYYDKGKQSDTYESTIDSMSTDMHEVERQFSLTVAELEQFRGKYVQVDSLLNVANSDLEQKKADIQALMRKSNRSAADNRRLKQEIDDYKAQIEKYIEQVDALILENQKLKDANDSLNNELSSNKAVRTNLEARLKVAGQLRADRVNITNFKKRLVGGKLVSTSLARRTVKSEACFTILENAVATQGEKLISLRLLAPNGKPLAGTSNGSFVDTQSGLEMTATANQKIDFTGSSQDLCMAWEGEADSLESGEYQVEIYIDGVLVFTSSYTLE